MSLAGGEQRPAVAAGHADTGRRGQIFPGGPHDEDSHRPFQGGNDEKPTLLYAPRFYWNWSRGGGRGGGVFFSRQFVNLFGEKNRMKNMRGGLTKNCARKSISKYFLLSPPSSIFLPSLFPAFCVILITR